MRVLLVEDDDEDHFLFKKLLERIQGASFDVVRARTFDDGLAAMIAGDFDVHFLDYRLGARDGVELLSEARQRGVSGPFIILTGAGDRRTDMEAMRAGADDFLSKERATPDVVDRAIRYAIERERTASLLRKARDELEMRVAERTGELTTTIRELRARETSERHARQAAERLYEEAQAASRLKDEFLASLSHELRTPMNAIIGYTELMREGAYGDEQELAGWLDIVSRNAKAQMRLIEDLLDVSRIVTGKLEVAHAPVDLALVVRDVASSFMVQADERGVALAVDVEKDVGTILGDQPRLEQVVSNLLSNALKFTPAGGHVTAALGADGAGSVKLRVTDDGQGISPEFLPHVFDRFRQEDGRITRKHGGLGLGLSLVRHFVGAHGGTVLAESAGPGKGATFTVTLPKRRVTKSGEGSGHLSSRGGESDAPLEGRSVLVVDDARDVRMYVTAVLSRAGARTTSVGSAGEAREALAAGEVDVILCDVAMPEENGYELVRDLRARGVRTPIAAMTAFAREEEKEQAFAAGFDAHLPKPIDAKQMVEAVRTLAASPRDLRQNAGDRKNVSR